MLKKYILLLPMLLLFASCFKYINVDNSLKYTATGIQDVTVDQNDSATLYVTIQLLSGDPTNEYIHCVVSGVPDSVSINYDSLTFRPNYDFRLVFNGHYPKPGVYPISLTTTSPTMGIKVYTFNLTVTSLIDCTQQFTEQFSPMTGNNFYAQVFIDGNTSTSNDFAYFSRRGCDTMSIEVIKDSASALTVGADPIQMLYQFSAFVNCTGNTLTIYPQNAQWLPPNEMIRGAGTFVTTAPGDCTITLYDTIYSGTTIISTSTISNHY